MTLPTPQSPLWLKRLWHGLLAWEPRRLQRLAARWVWRSCSPCWRPGCASRWRRQNRAGVSSPCPWRRRCRPCTAVFMAGMVSTLLGMVLVNFFLVRPLFQRSPSTTVAEAFWLNLWHLITQLVVVGAICADAAAQPTPAGRHRTGPAEPAAFSGNLRTRRIGFFARRAGWPVAAGQPQLLQHRGLQRGRVAAPELPGHHPPRRHRARRGAAAARPWPASAAPIRWKSATATDKATGSGCS